MFFEKPQTPQKNGTVESNRPFGPFGVGKVQSCSATCGASRTATAQAEGGFMISAAWPEISALLFEASSQAKTCDGSTGTSFWNHSNACLVASDLRVTLPSLSTSCAPKPRSTAYTQATASFVTPSGMP